MLGIVFLVAGWWFIRSGILYDGDFLGMKTSSIYAEKYAIDELKPGASGQYGHECSGYDALGAGKLAAQLAGYGTGKFCRNVRASGYLHAVSVE